MCPSSVQSYFYFTLQKTIILSLIWDNATQNILSLQSQQSSYNNIFIKASFICNHFFFREKKNYNMSNINDLF
jgi:hypothetical protein